jgi:putative phosphoribosyl transferase
MLGLGSSDRQRFADRREAGRALAQVLKGLALPAPTVLALPRGGVPVAAEVARVLGAPLDLLMVRKIGAPGQPELAVAAVAALPALTPAAAPQAGAALGAASGQDDAAPPAHTFVDPALMAVTGADQAHVDRGVAREGAELERRRRHYLSGRRPVSLDGRTVILVDDGIATGTTLRAALKVLNALRGKPCTMHRAGPPAPAEHPEHPEHPEHGPGSGRPGPLAVVLAVPVSPAEVLAALAGEVDATVCLWTPASFGAVGAHYRDFRQVSDDEVVALLAAHP